MPYRVKLRDPNAETSLASERNPLLIGCYKMSPLTKYAARALAIFYLQELSTLTTNNSTVSSHLDAVLQNQALILNIHVLYTYIERKT